jgi:hypothetical protein
MHAARHGSTRPNALHYASDNSASIRLLEKLGLRFVRSIEAPDTAHALQVFAMDIHRSTPDVPGVSSLRPGRRRLTGA